MSNTRIGDHYEVVRELRRGAWVTVFEARHEILGRRTLIKWLNPTYKEDEELVGRLRREARLGAAVDHPNVARIYEVGDADERPYVAIEWIEGDDLDAVLDTEGSFSVERTLRLARDLLAGLSAIHGVGVVHRDLSPMNVRVTPEGVARITDFGLATGPFDTHYTLPGSVVGTPGYLSPEQASGKNADERSDLFSCGILIHEALTGEALFKDDDLITTLKQVRGKVASPVEDRVEGIPAGMDQWLAKLLAKKADDRFRSAREALEALVAFTGGDMPDETRHHPKRVRPVTGWGVIALTVVAVFVGVLFLPGYLNRQARETGSFPEEIDTLLTTPGDTLAAATQVQASPEIDVVKEEPKNAQPDTRSEQEDAPLRTTNTAPDETTITESDTTPPVSVTEQSPEPSEMQVAEAGNAQGWLVIRTYPWADIYLDSRRIGATPSLLPVKHQEGPVRLTLDNPGFPPILIETMVTAAETTEVLIDLADHVGSLVISAIPWAKVYIDENPIGETPITHSIYLSPGTHILRFSHPEFGNVEREFVAEPGVETEISIDMSKEGTGFAGSGREEPR